MAVVTLRTQTKEEITDAVGVSFEPPRHFTEAKKFRDEILKMNG
jgi:hypothetical protein